MMPSHGLGSLSGGPASLVPGLNQQPPSSRNRSAMWYRFEIDCAAHPSGVSVKNLIKGAEITRRKAAAAAASSAMTSSLAAGASAARKANTPAAASSKAVHANVNGATTAGPDKDSTGDQLEVVAGGEGRVDERAEQSGSINIGVSGGEETAAAAGATNVRRAGDKGGAEGQSSATSSGITEALVAAAPSDASKGKGLTKQAPSDHPSNKAFRESKHKGGWMTLIERLELKHGGAARGIMTDSDEDSSDVVSEEESSSAEESGDGDGSGDGKAGGGGEGGTGGEKKKTAKRRRRRVVDELDYDDDFIDDSELEKVFDAKAASRNTKTVHSGFFANHGEVETMGPTSKKKSSGSGKRKAPGGKDGAGGAAEAGDGDTLKKKPKPAAATPDGGKVAAGMVAPSSKKKPKKTTAEGRGEEAIATVKGRDATEMITSTTGEINASPSIAGHSDKSATVPNTPTAAATVPTPARTASTNASAARTGNVAGGLNASGAASPAASFDSNTQAVGLGSGGREVVNSPAATAIGSAGESSPGIGTSSGKSGNGTLSAATAVAVATQHCGASNGVPFTPVAGGRTVGDEVVLANGDCATPVGTGSAAEIAAASGGGPKGVPAASSSGGGDGTSGGSDKSAADKKSAGSTEYLSPELEAALAKFIADSKPWVDAGRPHGDAAASVLEGLSIVDTIMRQSDPSIHNEPHYLERLSAVYGQASILRSTLVNLRREERKKECTALQMEFESLKTIFETKVAAFLAAHLAAAQSTPEGQPPSATFQWTDPLRGALHDLVRAFEAWAIKELGGLRTRQAMMATKELYEKLAQVWPVQVPMAPEELKKMYLNEKRRIKSKANKEAAAEGGGPQDSNKEGATNKDTPARSPAANVAPGTPAPPTPQSTVPRTPSSTSPSPRAALAALAAGIAAGGTPVLHTAGTPMPATPGAMAAQAATVSPTATNSATSAGAAISSPVSLPAPISVGSLPQAQAPAVAARGLGSGSPIVANGAAVPEAAAAAAGASPPHMPTTSATRENGGGLGESGSGDPSLLSSDLPPRGMRFQEPPEYDESEFFEPEEMEEEAERGDGSGT